MGGETEPNLRPDADGDAVPGGSTPSGIGVPKRQPKLSAGPIQHPLPELSEQEAAKIARKLADERARLDEQSARGMLDKPSRAGQPPSPVPHAFLPAQRRGKLVAASRLSAEPPGRVLRPSPLGMSSGPWSGCGLIRRAAPSA